MRRRACARASECGKQVLEQDGLPLDSPHDPWRQAISAGSRTFSSTDLHVKKTSENLENSVPRRPGSPRGCAVLDASGTQETKEDSVVAETAQDEQGERSRAPKLSVGSDGHDRFWGILRGPDPQRRELRADEGRQTFQFSRTRLLPVRGRSATGTRKQNELLSLPAVARPKGDNAKVDELILETEMRELFIQKNGDRFQN